MRMAFIESAARTTPPSGSPPRDRRDDRHLVAVLDGGREAAAKAHVLVVQIKVDEWIGLTLLVPQPRREGGVARGHVGHGLAQRAARRLDRPGAAGVGGEHGRQVQRDGHVRSSSTRVVTSRSRGVMTGASGTAPCTASTVFKPWPVMQSTTSSCASNRPARAKARAPAAVTPPAVSANTPVSSARKRIPSTSSESLTAAAQPPVSRIARAANTPSAGLPIARERQMVWGTSGSSASPPRSTRRTIGAHPAACAPYSRGSLPRTSPASRNSPNPFRSFERSEPPAIGATTAVGRRQPSCSAISYATVLDPSP